MVTEKIDVNSVVNQQIKGDFVSREVRACFSYEMEAILKAGYIREAGLPNHDAIENIYHYVCPECGHGEADMDDFKMATDDTRSDGGAEYLCPGCDSVLENEPESEAQEIFEWWIVSKYLYNRLQERGEPVLEWGNNCYWGRTCCGQSIMLDGVISSICLDMEILDGQVNSWAKK